MFKFPIQFQKVDKYKNNVFICHPSDKETYEKLTDINSKLETNYPDATSAIYINEEHEYLTLRTVKNDKYSFKQKNTYEINIQFKHKKNNDEKEFINAILTKSKCLERHIENHGDDVKL